MSINWSNLQGMPNRRFDCGHCGSDIASTAGMNGKNKSNGNPVFLYYCHNCGKMSFFDDKGNQHPGKKFGSDIEGIDDASVKELYDEARDCYSSNAFTASVMCCRKLLMNIAVSKGDKEGKRFVQYVEYLDINHYTPPNSEEWVKHIKDQGNEANHEIKMKEREDAEELITFLEMLLKFDYEFPERMRKKKSDTGETGTKELPATDSGPN